MQSAVAKATGRILVNKTAEFMCGLKNKNFLGGGGGGGGGGDFPLLSFSHLPVSYCINTPTPHQSADWLSVAYIRT